MSDTLQLAFAVQALAARQAVLSIALQEALRTLSRSQAEACGAAIRDRVGVLAGSSTVTAIAGVDEAVAQELAGVLAAHRT